MDKAEVPNPNPGCEPVAVPSDGSQRSKAIETASKIPLETHYQTYKELYFATLERQFAYGRWLLSSLLTVHLGSLVAISQAGDQKKALYHSCGALLIYGVAVSLLAGGLAWVNFSAAARAYGSGVKVLGEGRKPDPTRWQKRLVNLTLWTAPIAAGVSLTLFLIAAWRAMEVFAKAS